MSINSMIFCLGAGLARIVKVFVGFSPDFRWCFTGFMAV
jgi:hypothetical protein